MVVLSRPFSRDFLSASLVDTIRCAGLGGSHRFDGRIFRLLARLFAPTGFGGHRFWFAGFGGSHQFDFFNTGSRGAGCARPKITLNIQAHGELSVKIRK
jgi:hypothetical protein